MKLVAFGTSSSRHSLNKQLAFYVANQIKNYHIEGLDLNNYTMPIYSVDNEREMGLPPEAHNFVETIKSAELLVISMAEHNGSYTAAFKNIFDWATRVDSKLFLGKKILLLSTSPGPRGGIGAFETAAERFPHHGAEIVGKFSLPNFHQNFSETEGIKNEELRNKLYTLINNLN